MGTDSQGRGEAETMARDRVIFTDKEALSWDAALRWSALAAQAARANRQFTVALTGGSSPDLLYSLMASPPFQDSVEWRTMHLFFGDERCVPPDAPESNFKQAQDLLISRIAIPAENIHRIEGELPDPDEAAQRYEAELYRAFALEPGALPRFDLILLGMGSDGHCASLFPLKPALREQERLVVATEPGLQPFVPRITLTFPALNHASNILFLVTGEDKAKRVAQVLEGPDDPNGLPSQNVVPVNGTLSWLLDQAAAASLVRE